MDDISHVKGSGDIFLDLWFSPEEAENLSVTSAPIGAIGDTIEARKLTRKAAAALCDTDQATLSKVLRGRMESVTIDRLTGWLTALGRRVEIRVRPFDRRVTEAHFIVSL